MKRRIVAASLVAFISLNLSAQTTSGGSGSGTGTTTPRIANRPSLGVHIGGGLQNVVGEAPNGGDLNNGTIGSYNIGVNAEIPVGTGTFIQPEISYRLKGAELYDDPIELKVSYIDIPVNFVFKPMLGTGNMVLGFGPYVGIGIDGKVKYENSNRTQDVTFRKTFETTDNRFQMRRVDAGANFLAGYAFANRLSFQLDAQLGLVNVMPENTGQNAKWKNSGFGLSLGYRF